MTITSCQVDTMSNSGPRKESTILAWWCVLRSRFYNGSKERCQRSGSILNSVPEEHQNTVDSSLCPYSTLCVPSKTWSTKSMPTTPRLLYIVAGGADFGTRVAQIGSRMIQHDSAPKHITTPKYRHLEPGPEIRISRRCTQRVERKRIGDLIGISTVLLQHTK